MNNKYEVINIPTPFFNHEGNNYNNGNEFKINLPHLNRVSVGFDRFFDEFFNIKGLDAENSYTSYPPCNIEKLDEDSYRITFAIAGFSKKDLNVMVEDCDLTITGKIEEEKKNDNQEENAVTVLHHGIATRQFSRTFRLAEHVEVKEGVLKDGLLTIDLVRVLPESKKPKVITLK